MSRTYTRQNILEAFKKAGLRSDDTVFVTTSLGMLGLAEGINNGDELNQLFFDLLKEYFGQTGNVIVPTYSYTFGRSTATELQRFDPQTTPAEVGPFPEFFRKQPGVLRSLDPMMSVAGFGPLISDLFKDIPATSYGEDSIFARLTRISAKCCSIGLGPNWMPFIHYADWLCRAPFRYDKLFKGLLQSEDSLIQTSWLYTVPLLHPASHSTGHKIAALAEKAGIWQFAELGRARVYVADYRRYFDFTLEQLKKDQWMTADGPPEDPIKLEEQRVPPGKLTVATSATSEEIMLAAAKLHRACVSDNANNLLEKLCEAWQLNRRSFFTGGNCLDWVIPERWQLLNAEIRNGSNQKTFLSEILSERVIAYSLSRQQSIKKNDLIKHIKQLPDDHTKAIYHDALLNRDWGFSLSAEEIAQIPDETLSLDLQTGFSFGQLDIAFTPSSKNQALLLLIGYINGPAGGRDLLSAWAAHEVYQKLNNSSRHTNIACTLLILPGPAGFAAWLYSNAHLRHRIIGAIEFCRLDETDMFPIRIPENFADHSLIKPWQSFSNNEKITLRKNHEAYLLTSGENPIARDHMPVHEFPVVSVGSPLAAEYSSNGAICRTPFSQLQNKSFFAARKNIEIISSRLKECY